MDSQKKKIINILNCAERKIVCICIDVYKAYQGKDFN